MERFDHRLSTIRKVLSQNLNLFKLKSFETDTLTYLNALYTDLNNALDNGRMPYTLVDSEALLEYYDIFASKLSEKGLYHFQKI